MRAMTRDDWKAVAIPLLILAAWLGFNLCCGMGW